MRLMTKVIEKKLEKYPLYSQDGVKDKKFICKFFNPNGSGTWLVCEGEKQPDGDWLFFGKVSLGYGAEWGYFRLSDLQGTFKQRISINGKIYEIPTQIERDLHYHGEEEI